VVPDPTPSGPVRAAKRQSRQHGAHHLLKHAWRAVQLVGDTRPRPFSPSAYWETAANPVDGGRLGPLKASLESSHAFDLSRLMTWIARATKSVRRGRPAIKLVRCVSRRGSLIDLPIPENRGTDAYNNPSFYRQLAKDPERLMAAALDAQLTVIRLAW
jgi:hypothetical protein